MAYTDDWESLMNGVFGPGGKLKFSQSTPQGGPAQTEKPEKRRTARCRIERSPAGPAEKGWMKCSNSRMRP